MQDALQGKGQTETPQRGNFHPSYKARDSKSFMQVASSSAKFVDTRPAAVAASLDLQEAPLIIEEDKPERTAKYNPSLDSQLGGVFKQESFPEPPETVGVGNEEGYPTDDLIGGQPDPDRWKTMAQMLNNGESLNPKKVVKRSIDKAGGVLNPSLISPITGEKLGNYGSWEQDEVAAVQREEDEKAAKLRALEEEENDNTNHLIKKLKKTLSNRGASGILGLQKKFKNMDTDGSGTLSMKEFRRGMKEMRMNLSEAELAELFSYLDDGGTGEITYTSFMLKITGLMNVRRRKLVNMAFEVLDKDGDGLVTLDDIAAAYDVSKHPEFVTGKRTKAEILREFLDGFDVGGGEKDGIVTPEEFASYYTSISAIIQNDDYFELMMRNAWHISGGEGWAENSSNLRVLVTDSNGQQSVVEIKHDLGLDSRDKKAVVARLRAEGVDVVTIPGYSDPKGAAIFLAKKAAAEAKGDGKVKPAPRLGGPVASLRGQVQDARQVEEPTLPLVEKLRAQLKTRGANGFIGLQRAFRLLDEDGSNFLELGEFRKAMKSINVLLTDKQSADLFNFFDADKSGTISLDEFMRGLQGPMSERRHALVDAAFNILDVRRAGTIEPSDLVGKYDSSKHPDVLSKKKTPEEVLKIFLDSFDVGGEVDGKVTKNEFENYYANVSASIDSDDYFELMIRNAWHISGGEGQAANSANRRVLVTRADGSQSVEEIKNDLGLKADDKAGMMARLKAQGVDASKVELYGGADDNNNKSSGGSKPPLIRLVGARPPMKSDVPGSRRPSNNSVGSKINNDARVNQPPMAATNARPVPSSSSSSSSSSSGGVGGGGGGGGGRPVQPPFAPPAVQRVPPAPTPALAPSPSPSPAMLIIGRLKDGLKGHGVHGFVSLQRTFRIMNDLGDGNLVLSLADFKKGMRELLGLTLTDAELRMLFDFFDMDHSGAISFDEFIRGVRDPLTRRRLDMVAQAFSLLDPDNLGVADVDHIATLFDSSNHPDVVSKKKTPQQVLREFLGTFGAEVDGKVTFQEFVEYYTNLGASIDSDDYFELMIRNAWHISGGTGWAANSANRRVLVTDSKGRQSVVEIKNDLGLKADDKAGMMARLKAQGVDASKVELYGGADAARKGSKESPKSLTACAPFDEGGAAELKRSALQLFNAGQFAEAGALFSELMSRYYASYGPGHPEVEKLEKSVSMCEKRAVSLTLQQQRQK